MNPTTGLLSAIALGLGAITGEAGLGILTGLAILLTYAFRRSV
jgi:hypothetical protein